MVPTTPYLLRGEGYGYIWVKKTEKERMDVMKKHGLTKAQEKHILEVANDIFDGTFTQILGIEDGKYVIEATDNDNCLLMPVGWFRK